MRLLADPPAGPSTSPGRATWSRCGPRRAVSCADPAHRAAVDLATLAGRSGRRHLRDRQPKDEGAMAQATSCVFADDHGLALISIADLIAWRRRNEKHVPRRRRAHFSTTARSAVGYTSAFE